MITESKKEQIKLNLEALDLDVIQKTMSHFGWTWRDAKTGIRRVPSTTDIAAVAKNCMEIACESEDNLAIIGAFEAVVVNGVIEIRFILTKANQLLNLPE